MIYMDKQKRYTVKKQNYEAKEVNDRPEYLNHKLS